MSRPRPKRRVTELDLHCQTCSAFYEDRGSPKKTEESARIAGWGVWAGETNGGKAIRLVSCPKCRNDRSRGTLAERRKPPEGSVPLF